MNIWEQILIMSTNSTLRMNIRLIKVPQIFNQFRLNIKYKLDKNHKIFDAFFRFVSINTKTQSSKHSKLNVLFTYNTTLIEMSNKFYDNILKRYFKNLVWKNIATMIQNNETFDENAADFSFDTYKKISIETNVYIKSRFEFSTNEIETNKSTTSINKLLYHINKFTELRRLCISNSCLENIMKIVYNNDYSEFVRCFEIISQT